MMKEAPRATAMRSFERATLTLTALFSILLSTSAHAEDNLPAKVTFTEHIAPIIFGSCTECHRPGEPAPFTLESYRDVRKRARMIRKVTKSRFMPPWHPVPGHGDFADSRRLSERQISIIDAWVESGLEEGPADRLPKLPEYTTGWRLGKPDLVVSMDRAFEVPADGPDIYRNFAIPLGLDEDKWVTAVEVRPAARSVVHHVLFFLDDSGTARRRDGSDGKPGFRGMGFQISGSLGGWAVGGTPRKLPLGLARPLRKGADLVLATHFHPSGKAEREKTTIGLYFAEKKPDRTLAGFQVPPVFGRFAGIDVPPGEREFKIDSKFTVPVDLDLVTASGHAHYICRKMNAEATLPDGTKLPLFRIDDWDFNWQGNYTYAKPVRLPKGTVIEAKLVYDNSDENPRNPFSPPKRIRWGRESTDEMGSLIFNCVAADEKDFAALESGIRAERRRDIVERRSPSDGADESSGLVGRLLRLDQRGNKNGKVERSEVPRQYRAIFDRFDPNKDGVLDEKELERARRSGRAIRERGSEERR